MMGRRRWRSLLIGAAGALLLTAACTHGRATSADRGPAGSAIRIASFDFVESEILAQLYGQALRAHGYPVHLLLGAGTRELVEPALATGLVDLVPEYGGSALSFLTLGTQRPTPDEGLTHQELAGALAGTGVEALAAAPAQDANAIVVTQATALRYGLANISDLIWVDHDLVFGGPPECPQRPLCLLGLERTYGLSFKGFVALDTGGPLTVQALRSGGIDVALLFSTDPVIEAEHLVVLDDDGRLQPAENVTPVVRRATLARFGPGVADTVNAVSAALTTLDLRTLVGRAGSGQAAARVAGIWLAGHGLT